MASFIKWLFGGRVIGEDQGDNDEDDDPNRKKKSNLPKSSHAKDVGQAMSKIGEMEKRRQNLYAKAKEWKDQATEFGKKAGASKNASQKAAFKRQGLAALQKSKMHENQAEKLGQMLMNYELTALEAESMSATVEIVDGMKDIKGTMATISLQLDGDAVSDLMGEIEDHVEIHADIVSTLSTPMQGTTMIDVVDMEDEFDTLMAEEENRLEEEREVNALKALEDMEKVSKKVPSEKTPVSQEKVNVEENQEKEDKVDVAE